MDFFFTNQGTICSLYPETETARNWCDDFIDESAFRYNGAYIIERRFAADLLAAIESDGMTGNWL